ncbi:alpha/beta fold hydrolase [Pelomonas sp. KK5]|uniref:alpha/beta fold hydrolase n=1 Tax=Pelomonas sp. KK5 TaxID=1855730 RepID=UPI00097C988F|nr:alpha/beta hydrolase family protein [Pelomonas sp. KK5]
MSIDIDPISGVAYTLHGPADGEPLMVTMPLMASFTAIFGDVLTPVLDGYLSRLTDRYRVLLVDYPSIGASRDIPPEQLTADRVCADLLAVATAAGFGRFSYWGYSWAGGVGLQLATRTDRLKALVIGGWPPIGGPYQAIADAAERKQHDPEPSSMIVLRSKAQYVQWIHYNRSVQHGWDETAALKAMRALPKLVFHGELGDLVEAGIPVPIASLIRDKASALRELGWETLEVPGVGHEACIRPELFVPAVRAFLDRSLG